MRRILPFILAAALFCGCSAAKVEEPGEAEFENSIAASPEPIEIPLESPSQNIEEAPPPDIASKALDIPAGMFLERFEDDHTGDYLDYWLIVPPDATENLPLLVYLHGDGDAANPSGLEQRGINVYLESIYGEELPFVVLMPNTRQRSWTEGTIPETLIHLVEDVADSCASDKERIMLTGHSRGAIGTWYAISHYPYVFSCAVPISCGCDDPLDYEEMASVPVWGFSGSVGHDGSHYYPAMQRIAEEINAHGGDASVTMLEGCDHMSVLEKAYTEEVFNWMLKQ
ncbi:MAG: hypothetical protein E7420_01950 [Ruminococcaceae bacterium]|nr:hypothetical protein [Oscillospiraceae bacterium]